MYFIPILLFVFVFYGLGLAIYNIIKYNRPDNAIEHHIMIFGLGLGVFPLMTIFLSWVGLIKMPVYLGIALISYVYEIYLYFKNKKEETPEKKINLLSFKKSTLYFVLVVIFFLIHMFVFYSGAVSYPYMEDGDPLAHSLGVKYIQETGSYSVPIGRSVAHYLEPYPPFYDAFMSIFLGVTDNDVVWVLKFFNSLFVSLSIIFMFFFVKEATKSNEIALISSFILTLIPSYMSHFIFATTYATMLFFPALYFLIRIKDNFVNYIPAAVLFSGVFLVQPTASGIFVIFILAYLFVNLKNKDIRKYVLISAVLGLILSQLFWTPAFIKYGFSGVSSVLGFNMFVAKDGVDVDSSGNAVYRFNDFYLASTSTKIDQPTGVGQFIFILTLIGIILLLLNYKKLFELDKFYLYVLLLFFVLLIGVEGNYFPYKFVPHRLWCYFAIPLAIISSYAFYSLLAFDHRLYTPGVKIIVGIIIVFGIIVTSGIPKYKVETSQWGPGPEYGNIDELMGYMHLMQILPKNTPVMLLCDSFDLKATSSNLNTFPSDFEISDFQKQIKNKTGTEIYDFMVSKKIRYLIVDTSCTRRNMNETEINEKIGSIVSLNRFKINEKQSSFLSFEMI